MGYTKEDIIRIVEEEDVKFIRMQFVDIFGQLKNVAITSSQLQKALDNRITMDGSSIEGFARVEESDQFLVPDLNSFAIFPWRPQHGKVARLICDIYNPDGTPFIGDSRHVLRNVLKRARDMGYTFLVGPECEFFLFETDENGRPTIKPGDDAGYFDLSPLDHGESIRREICLALEEIGFEIEASHHEVAAGQHEIDFKYEEAMHAADNLTTFKLAVKTLAQKNGLYATFMPKPIFGTAGSGLHINMSLLKDGRNVFDDPEDRHGLSADAYRFIAGILAHIQGMTAILNPLVNSYKRLVPGYEAPCYVSWSAGNRSALVRIPSTSGASARIELRSPDPACNPYLALAVCLAAGLDGIEQQMEVPEEIRANVYQMSEPERHAAGIETLPASLNDALYAMKADPLVTDTLGPHVVQVILDCKTREWEDYRTRVTNWEIEKYMMVY